MNVKKFAGSLTLTALLALPLTASADSFGVNTGTGVFVGANGIVRVIGAQVTSISDSILNAITSFGNIVLNWNVTATSTTKIIAAGSKNATLADIHVGDRIRFVGTTTSTSSPFAVTARKIVDMTTTLMHGLVVGTASDVNASAQTFTLTGRGHRTLMVQANASTTISQEHATTTFASIQNGDEVKVGGVLNADGSVLTATRIVIKHNDDRDEDNRGRGNRDDDDDDRGHRGEGRDFIRLFDHFRFGVERD